MERLAVEQRNIKLSEPEIKASGVVCEGSIN